MQNQKACPDVLFISKVFFSFFGCGRVAYCTPLIMERTFFVPRVRIPSPPLRHSPDPCLHLHLDSMQSGSGGFSDKSPDFDLKFLDFFNVYSK